MHKPNHTMDIIAMNQSTQTRKTVAMSHDMKRTIITIRNHTEKIAMDLNIHPNTLTAIAMNQQHQAMEMTITTIGNPIKPIAMNQQQQAMEWMTIITKKLMEKIIAMTSHNTNLINLITSQHT